MAQKINSADPTYSIIEEVTPGVTPEVGTRYELPVSTDQAPPVYSTAEITSNTKRPKRASNGSQQGMSSVEWTPEFRLIKSEFMDLLLKSGLSGTWATNKLSAADVDTFFSVETCLKADTGVDPDPANGMYYVDAGCIVNSVDISGQAGDGVTISFGMLGLSREESDVEQPTTLAAVATGAKEFTYKDIKNVKLYTGASTFVELGVSSISLTIPHEREIRQICGQQEGVDIGTSGARKITGELSIYRESFQINTDVTGLPQKLTFEVANSDGGYRFTIPGATFQRPTDELSGSSVLANLSLTGAQYDETAGTDIFIERI